MSSFVELVIGCEVAQATPGEVVETLNYMSGQAPPPAHFPDHPFFEIPDLPKGAGLLIEYPCFSFPGVPHIHFGPGATTYRLSVRNYIKSNAHREIQKFLHWLAPYCESNQALTFIGYLRHEEDLHPTLIYFGEEGTVYLSKVNLLEPLVF